VDCKNVGEKTEKEIAGKKTLGEQKKCFACNGMGVGRGKSEPQKKKKNGRRKRENDCRKGKKRLTHKKKGTFEDGLTESEGMGGGGETGRKRGLVEQDKKVKSFKAKIDNVRRKYEKETSKLTSKKKQRPGQGGPGRGK